MSKSLNYKDFQSFLVQYETLMPDLLDSKYLLKDRIDTLVELIKQNEKLLAAVGRTHFIPTELMKHAIPVEDVVKILNNSHQNLNDILLNLQPVHRLRYS